MAERLKATVLKTVVPEGTGGSNPSRSVGEGARRFGVGWVRFFGLKMRVGSFGPVGSPLILG